MRLNIAPISSDRFIFDAATGWFTAACLTFGVENVGELIVKLETVMNSVNYGLTELRRDLNDMKKCWKICR